jgi:hypothetical protein
MVSNIKKIKNWAMKKSTALYLAIIAAIGYVIYWITYSDSMVVLARISISVSLASAVISIYIVIRLQKSGIKNGLLTFAKVIDIIFIILSGLGVVILVSLSILALVAIMF